MDWKKIGRKLLYPNPVLLLLLCIVCGIALVYVFVNGLELTIPAYFVYGVSAYTLTASTAFLARILPKIFAKLKFRLNQNSIVHHYMTDKSFRARVSLYLSLCINLLYVALQIVHWFQLRSWWFVILAVYYSILSVMRFLLVRFVQKNEIGTNLLAELLRSRTCACILLLVNLILSAAVLMILFQEKGYNYNGILIYVMAVYTFYSTIRAAIDITKYRRMGNPIMSTAKIISLSAALVSMLNLETAMFAQFGGDMAREHQRIFIILTGAGVSIIIISLSVQLIYRTTKIIRRLQDGTT